MASCADDRGLTIGQAAAFGGVTITTVRHYHRLGLLPEPGRDSSGYRRYASTDLLRLVQVRTLAEAGVALKETGDLLDDREYVELQKRSWDASCWAPDDPRLDELACALADDLLTHRSPPEAQADSFSTPDATTRYELITNDRADQLPTLTRLTALIEARLRAAGLDIPSPAPDQARGS